MAGQGATIQAISSSLTGAGWTVLYTCVPGTAHVGVVAIPTRSVHSRQRYPDALATRGDATLMVEVEPRLNPIVAEEMLNRFEDHIAALSDRETWVRWRSQVESVTGHALPAAFNPRCELVVIREPIPEAQRNALEGRAIRVCSATGYEPIRS